MIMKKTQYCEVSITIHGKARDVDAHLFRGIANDFTSNLSPTCCFPSGAGQTGRSANRLRRHSAKPWQGNAQKSVGRIIVRNYDEQTTNVEVLPDWLEVPRNVTVELWRHIFMTNAMPLGK